MLDKLSDILKGIGPKQPPEIQAVKTYIKAKFDSDVGVAIKPGQITVLADSAALAGTLRMHLPQLQKAIKTDKKLVIRIGK